MSDYKVGTLERSIVDSGLLTAAQVATQINNSKSNGIDLIAQLYSQKDIDESKLATLIAKEYGYKRYDWESFSETFIPKEHIDGVLAVQHEILPLKITANSILQVAICSPKSLKAVDQLKFKSGLKVEIYIAERSKIVAFLAENFKSSTARGLSANNLVEFIGLDDNNANDDGPDNAVTDDDANRPVIKYINNALLDAVAMGASDLHFEPLESSYRIRLRVDGILRTFVELPKVVSQRFTSRLKVLSSLDISERRKPQDGRMRLKFSENKTVDFRVSTLPTVFGEKVVIRILDQSSALISIDKLGFEPEQEKIYLEALNRPQGMILITGPTGSGKTVSLYTGLGILNTDDRNISTAEDPVEINLPGVSQVSISPKSGLTFANTLRAFLRQDPDVIMVGEIRDLETAEIAVSASQTGHLVLSTLHTNSAAETLTRLKTMGVPAFNIASSVNLVIAQRLVRRLCQKCKKEMEITTGVKNTLLTLGFTNEAISSADFKIYEAVGCAHCTNGYTGRTGVYEVVKITKAIANLILEDGNANQITDQARLDGFNSLRQSGLNKVMAGVTTIHEIARVTSE